MKSLFANLWKRRACRIVLWVAILLGLASLHPFARQMVFGPKINGVPWCVYEAEIRRRADRNWRPSFVQEWQTKLGLEHGFALTKLQLRDPDFVPLLDELAEDSDVKVRHFALEVFAYSAWKTNPTETTAVLQRHVNDADLECRMTALGGLWRLTKDKALIASVLDATNGDPTERWRGVSLLAAMAVEEPALFEPLAKFVVDDDPRIRLHAMLGMGHFGKRGIPLIQKGLRDPDSTVRYWAVEACSKLGPDAAVLARELTVLTTDPGADTRVLAKSVLEKLSSSAQPPVPVDPEP